MYPNTILTIGDQVTASGQVWKAYIEDMGRSTCIHPNSDALDNAVLPFAGTDYATRHNPFIYFHSLLDLGGCSNDDVSLDRLTGDLGSVSKTPTYALIAPGLCEDASSTSCPDGKPAGLAGEDASSTSCPDGKPAGLAGEDAFLKNWVPRIPGSAAYKRDGVLIITFALSGAATEGGPVPTGALVLSRFATANRTISTTHNPYSALRSVEDLLGYTPLAHAKSAPSFVSAALPGA